MQLEAQTTVFREDDAVWVRPLGFIDASLARDLVSYLRTQPVPREMIVDLTGVSGLSSRAHRFWRLWLRQVGCQGATVRLRSGGSATVRMATYFLSYSAGCHVVLEE